MELELAPSVVEFSIWAVESPKASAELRDREHVAPLDADVLAHERRETSDVLLADGETLRAELLESRVHAPGVEQHDDVEHEPERTELILHSVAAPLPKFATVAVEEAAGQVMAPLLEIRANRSSPVGGRTVTPKTWFENPLLLPENAKTR